MYTPKRIIIWSFDTDVASMCPRAVHLLHLQQLFFKTGVKDKKRFITMHYFAESIGSEVSVILPILQTVTLQAPSPHMGKTYHLKLFMMIWTILWRLDTYLAMIPLCYPLVLFPHLSSICHTLLYTGKEEYCSISLMRKELFCKKTATE